MNPLYDPVVMLQETPYRRWNIVDKNDLLRQGKLTLHLTCSFTDKIRSKERNEKEIASALEGDSL